MAVRPRRISDFKPLLTNLAQTSHYEVQFGALPSDGDEALKKYLQSRGVDIRFILENAGLLCYNASLPTTNLGSNSIVGNFMGIQEKFAHSRIYDEIGLDFYVDKDYKMLKFLESWMEFIASGSFNPIGLAGENAPISQNLSNYFVRMQYPAYYKANAVKIIKFDRDYKKEIEYNFRGLYPRNISSIPVSYMASDVLKVSATFSYDRYIAGKSNSINQYLFRDDNNKQSNQPQEIRTPTMKDVEEISKKTQEVYSYIFNPQSSSNNK